MRPAATLGPHILSKTASKLHPKFEFDEATRAIITLLLTVSRPNYCPYLLLDSVPCDSLSDTGKGVKR